MSVQSHHRELQGPPRPAWAWGEAAGPPPAAAPPEPEPAPQPEPEPVMPDRPAPAAVASPLPEPPPYLGAQAPEPEGMLARLLAAPAVPVDRTANRVERLLVMALLVGGWALGLSSPGFGLALPLVAVLLLAAGAHPALSLARLISERVLPAARIGGPWFTTEDPAPQRLAEAVAGGVLLSPRSAPSSALRSPPGRWAGR